MNFTITNDQVKDLHNARVYLLYAIEDLNKVLQKDFIEKLNKVYKTLDKVASPLMDEYDNIRDKKAEKCWEIAKENNFVSTWSMYEVDLHEPSNITAGVLEYLGNYVSIPENTTWLDMWRLADKLIKDSGDLHHTFIEDFVVNEDEVTLLTGS